MPDGPTVEPHVSMGYSIADKNPNVRQLVVDTFSDLAEVNSSKFSPGTTCFVIESRTTCILSNAGEWVSLDEGNGRK